MKRRLRTPIYVDFPEFIESTLGNTKPSENECPPQSKRKSRIIRKKCWPEFFEAITSGEKKFEMRLADFECAVGDTLLLDEWDPKTKEYTGRVLKKQITFVVKTKDLSFWSKRDIDKYGFQVFSLSGKEASLVIENPVEQAGPMAVAKVSKPYGTGLNVQSRRRTEMGLKLFGWLREKRYWFHERAILVRRVRELEKGILDIGSDLADRRIMFMHALSPDYVVFLEGIINRMGDLLGEKEAD